MIKEPSILILDDSLSAVDTKTEDLIFKNVFNKESSSTKIIISHRVSTLKYCDNIIVLKDGEIIQKGNHNKLKKDKGYYKEIYSEQMEAKKLNNFDN
jgi:ATP-binding cassette subfamily B protein